jgi:ATP-dependent Clp protease ATP-binding subunit ClpX
LPASANARASYLALYHIARSPRYSTYNRSDFTGDGFSAFYDPDQPTRGPLGSTSNIPDSHITPKRLRTHLDRFVVDQDRAKVVLSVAIHEHFLRVQELRRQHDEHVRLDAQAQRRASATRHPVEGSLAVAET